MTDPTYLNSQPSPFPLEFNEDQPQYLLFMSPKTQAASSSSSSLSSPKAGSSSSSSLSSPIFFFPTQDHGGCYHGELQQLNNQQEADKYALHGGLYDHSTLENENDHNDLKLSIWKKEEDRNENQSENGSMKWMSSKMRLMRKMMNVDPMGAEIPTNTTQTFKIGNQKQPSSLLETGKSGNNSSFNNNNNTIRVCSDCNTTKTPLWRSGPRGPKSLCNACGIRQRKARRAMAAANGTIIATDHKPTTKTKVQHKDKKSSNGYVGQHKKRCKVAAAPSHGRKKKLCFEDFTISMSKNSAFQRVFPQDEKEAAILLMALSYGLVHG